MFTLFAIFNYKHKNIPDKFLVCFISLIIDLTLILPLFKLYN